MNDGGRTMPRERRSQCGGIKDVALHQRTSAHEVGVSAREVIEGDRYEPSAASALPGPADDKDALAHIRFLARGCLTKPVQHLEGARVTQRRASGSLRRDEGGRFRGGAVASVLGLGLMMKAAVSEGAAQPFMKEEKSRAT